MKTFLPKQDPRTTFLRNYYGGEDGSNLTSTGSIASGLMAGYNPVSGNNFLNKITGGFLPGKTFGLQNAYDRRIKAIENTIKNKYLNKGRSLDETKLDERLAKLREEKRKEAEALNRFGQKQAEKGADRGVGPGGSGSRRGAADIPDRNRGRYATDDTASFF